MIWRDCLTRGNDGRKLDHKTLEALRIRAVDRVGEGAHPEDVAAALHRAYQQDPQAVDRWKKETCPGIRSDCHAGTTWSPVGQAPEVKNTGARYTVNTISAVSASARPL